MLKQDTVDVGIGFATGQKSFRKVLKTNVLNWQGCGLTQNPKFNLSLFVTYDLRYANTKITDYTNIPPYLFKDLNDTFFLGRTVQVREIRSLVRGGVLSPEEVDLFFCAGYAGQRNAVFYWAMKNQMDYLLFLDDDEYPMTTTNTRNWAVWSGQYVLLSHLQQIMDTGVNIAHGHHCGYISLIPSIEFSSSLTEEDLRTFIEAISNNIIDWQSLESLMQQGGVTYADTAILTSNKPQEVFLVNHRKSISGSNLCINLTDSTRVRPFYNPSRARGEDTFLSTLLESSRVSRIPCYTFHNSFSAYDHLMDGVLPIRLRPVCVDLDFMTDRFYRACVGWVRCKPLLLYLTQRENHESRIEEMHHQLATTLPELAAYLGRKKFLNIANELERYHQNIKLHAQQFQQTIEIWHKLVSHLETERKMQRFSASASSLSTADSLHNAL